MAYIMKLQKTRRMRSQRGDDLAQLSHFIYGETEARGDSEDYSILT